MVDQNEMSQIKSKTHPKVLVLMATFNGGPFIEEQIVSILWQVDVDVSICVRDDCSTDDTIQILERNQTKKVRLDKSPVQSGSSGRNFYNLIMSNDATNFDYVALADQDDIWLPSKLKLAIAALNQESCDGVSSDFYVFKEHQSVPLSRKSNSQKIYDYLFEGPGPGCSFVLKKDGYESFRQWLIVNAEQASNFVFHDWLIYAYYRHTGLKWHISTNSQLLYRQHSSNVLGANHGFSSSLARLGWIVDGTFSAQVDELQKLLGVDSRLIKKKSLDIRFLFQFRRQSFSSIFVVCCLWLRVL